MSGDHEFPIPLHQYQPIALDPTNPKLTAEHREILAANIQLCRDAIIFFTAIADAKGLGGHTGGPYDTVPEVCIMHAFMKHAAAGGRGHQFLGARLTWRAGWPANRNC